MDLFDLFARIQINLDDFDRGLNEASNKFKNFSNNLTSIGKGMKDLLNPAVEGFKAVESVGQKAADVVKKGLTGFAAVSTAVGGFGAAAVKSGMSFDSTMSEVSAISGAAGEEFDSLRDKALEMGAKTKFSASEAAAAMTYMAMAGWKTSDMLGGIEGIMNLAAASGEDLAATSDIVTDALTAFGMSADESGHFADILAVASSNANTNVGMMGETFKYVAPIAGAMGYSAEDAALAIGLMANSGIKATQAGTALRSIITRMAKPTKESGTAMDALGISITNADGSMKSLGEIIGDLRTSFDGLSESEKASYAAMLGGQEAMSGLLAIVSAAPADVEKLTNAINDCNGAAEEMAAIMVDNLKGDLTLLGSAFESLQIAISDSLTPTLREFAQFGQRAMSSLLEGFQGGGVLGFMSSLKGVIAKGITILSDQAPKFANVAFMFIETLANGILDSKDAIVSASKSTISMLVDGIYEWFASNSKDLADFGWEIVVSIFQGFTGAGEVISSYIGDFILVIADAFMSYHDALFTVGIDILGAIGKGIVENKEEIHDLALITIERMVTALRDNAPAIIEGGIALLEALVGAIMDNLPLILSTGAEIVGELIKGISGSMPALIVAVGAIVPYISKIIDVVGGIGKAVTDVIGVVKKVGSAVKGLFSILAANPIALVVAAVAALAAGFIYLWNTSEDFRNFWIGLWEGLKSIVSSAVDAIVGFFTNLADGIGNALSGVAEFIGGIFSSAWELVQGAWSAAVEFFSNIVSGIQSVFDGIGEFLGGLFSGAWELVQSAWSAATEFFSGIGEGIRAVFEAVTGAVGDFFSAAWEKVQGVWEVVSGFFSDIAEGIEQAFETATAFLSDAFSSAWEAVQGAWNAAVGFFGNIWASISNTFSGVASFFGDLFSRAWEAVTSAWDGVTEFFSGIWESITGVFSNVWEKFKEIGGNIVSGIKDGITGAWDAFTGWLGNMVGGIVDGVKNMLGIHSPSTVFAGIGENMALGLAEGWDNEYSDIKRQIERGMDFGTATVGISANGTGYWTGNGQQYGARQPVSRGGDTFNFYSPKALDPVSAAREMKRAKQQMALGYVGG